VGAGGAQVAIYAGDLGQEGAVDGLYRAVVQVARPVDALCINAGWRSSEKIEALRSQWIEAPDLTARKAVAEQIQLQAVQDVPYCPLGQYLFATAYRTGLKAVGNGFPIFRGIEKP
jgi:ABC-type transport system substrate-binding protein